MLCRFGIVFIPSVRNVFSLTELSHAQWGIVAGISLLPLVIMELQKKLNEVLFGRTVYEYRKVSEM